VRGRPPGSTKEKADGLIKATVELDPQAVAAVDNIKAASRRLKTFVPSRSEIICRALRGFDKRYTESLEQVLAEVRS